MGKSFHLLTLFCLLFTWQAAVNADTNPFNKVKQIDVEEDVVWQVRNGAASKESQNDKGSYYQLKIDTKSLRLRIAEDSGEGAVGKSFKNLVIEDLKLDGKRLPVFQWCLKNQTVQNRFLLQDLVVAQGICVNNGSEGEFVVKLNKQTLDALQKGRTLSFKIKPFRTVVEVNFALDGLADVLQLNTTKPEPVIAKAVAPQVPNAVVETCVAPAPAAFKTISDIPYPCNDEVSKQKAENTIKAAVKTEKARLAQVKAQRERKRMAAIAAKKKAEQERLQAEAAALAEQQAIAESQQKHKLVVDELTKKMLGVCNKMWARGKHRCYCEKYIEHAPVEIQNSSTCSN